MVSLLLTIIKIYILISYNNIMNIFYKKRLHNKLKKIEINRLSDKEWIENNAYHFDILPEPFNHVRLEYFTYNPELDHPYKIFARYGKIHGYFLICYKCGNFVDNHRLKFSLSKNCKCFCKENNYN